MDIFIKKFDELTVFQLYDILKLRFDVFVLEQKCFYDEIDNIDKDSIHFFIMENNEVIAYLRVIEKGIVNKSVTIGRVVVKVRNNGFASVLLKKALLYIKDEMHEDKVYLEAQVYAKSLYEKVGFKIVSKEFLEEGIPHVSMEYDFRK